MTAAVQNAFRALADSSRRQILLHLSSRDMTIAQVAEHFDMTRAAVKKHLTILEEGKLISVRPRGRERINRLEPKALRPVAEWVSFFDQFWDNKIGKLKAAVETAEGKK